MRDAYPQILALGAGAVLIGHGTVEQARAFAEAQSLPFPVLTDPTRRSYLAAGFLSGLGTVLSLKTLRSGVRAFRQGFRQSATQGELLQQGGALVIAPSGETLYHFVSQAAGDLPPMEEVLASLGAPREPAP